MFRALWHWIEVHTGSVNESGPYYGFWSGFGSDLGELALLGSIAAVWRHHNCGVQGCWRIGRHRVAGTTHTVCRRHHPEDAPSAQQVIDDHERGKMP